MPFSALIWDSTKPMSCLEMRFFDREFTMLKPALIIASTALAASTQGATVLFDFGSVDYQTTETGWNNVTYATGSPAAGLTTIVDSTGATLNGISLVFTDQFYTKTQPSLLGTDSPTGDAAALPATATEDFFLGHTGTFNDEASNPTGAFKLTGLDANQTYSFTFFASRVGVFDNRETSYTVTGDNSATGLLQATGNSSDVLTLSGITPDINNEILIDVAAGSNNNSSRTYYYINSLEVEIVPEPTSMALLGLGGLLLTTRRPRRR